MAFYNIQYESRILNALNKPYTEFWRTIEQTGQTSFSGSEYAYQLATCLRTLTELINTHRVYMKYQVYRKIDGELIGFFDPYKVYRGISFDGSTYYQNDTINVLVLTKMSSDTLLQPTMVRTDDRSMITRQINQRVDRFNLY